MTVHDAVEKAHEQEAAERAHLRAQLKEAHAAIERALEYNLHSVMRRADVRLLCVALHGKEKGLALEADLAARNEV
jgi:hypothetical protein